MEVAKVTSVDRRSFLLGFRAQSTWKRCANSCTGRSLVHHPSGAQPLWCSLDQCSSSATVIKKC